MSDTEYTLTDVDVRVRYALDRGSAIQRPYSTALAEFDRWLAAHDAELTERVRAEQREADAQIADDMNDHWVADTIREAATDG